MKFKNYLLQSAFALALMAGTANAQETDAAADDTSSSKLPAFLNKMYIGAGLGTALSFTDVKQYPTGLPVFRYRTELGYGYTGFAGYKLNRSWAIQGQLSWVRLNGTDRAASIWFTSSVLQWDLGVKFNVTNAIMKKSIDTRKFDVNLLGGLGMTAFRSSLHWLVNGYSSDPVGAVTGYNSLDLDDKNRRTMAGSVFGGLNVNYRLNDKIDIFLDLRGYIVNSDYLDVNPSTSNTSLDKYSFNTIGAIYHINGTKAERKKLDSDDPEAKLNEILEKFKDTDGDGVADYQDKDNSTPAGVKVYADGTAIDTDGDGVADYLDKEKISPCKDVDANGVAKDTDGDGVADCNDIEPNTEKGAQVDSKGKAIKTGPIGVSTPAATSGGSGSTASAGVMSGLPSIFFESNSKSLGYKNYPALTQVAQFLKANPGAKLIIVGNADKVGSDEYNKALAEKRAQAVVDHLVKMNGIDASRLSVVSKGSSESISTKRNAYQDRRVDFLLAK